MLLARTAFRPILGRLRDSGSGARAEHRRSRFSLNPRVSAREFAGPGKLLQDRDELTTLVFDDNRLLAALFGEHDEHLALIEHRLGVDIARRGNRVAIKGPPSARGTTEAVLNVLYERIRGGLEVTRGDVEGAIRMSAAT